MLAAVMPLPSEEVTPPVTKTYFAMGQVLRGFFQCYRIGRSSGQPGLPRALAVVAGSRREPPHAVVRSAADSPARTERRGPAGLIRRDPR